MGSDKRLNVKHPNILNKNKSFNKSELNDNKELFEKWLVGMVDGDGSFSIIYQNSNWNLTFKIGLSSYNLRALFFIKKKLTRGSIYVDKANIAHFRIRDKISLEKIIIPIFDKYPLLTSKAFNYNKFKQALNILNDSSLTKKEKDEKLHLLKKLQIPDNYYSGVWKQVNNLVSNWNDANLIITKPWLTGFIEAEGSFYLTFK